jgi:hypothetical protein
MAVDLLPNLMQRLEQRLLFSAAGVPQEPLPTTPLTEFVVNTWDNDVTPGQFSVNDFFGNGGPLLNTELSLSPESNSPIGNSLRLTKGTGSFGGYFTYLFAPPFIDSTLNPQVPATAMAVPDRFLDTQDVYRGFGQLADRSVEQLKFDVRHAMAGPLFLKIELKDEVGRIVSATRSIAGTGTGWTTVTLNIPADFSGSAAFDWRRVDHLVFVVDDAVNPSNWTFLMDNLRFADTTGGAYPDLAAMTSGVDGTLLPQYTDGFLEHVRRLSSLFFIDYASPFPGTGGMIQDTSTSPALATIGGVGFQLTSYVINARTGDLSRTESADRVVKILRVLHERPQGSGSVGHIGYEGFFYHFLGIDGLRKQNFGSTSGPEVSPIDTALAIAGVVTVGQYFTGNDPVEAEIRSLSNTIYGRVNWRFMLNDAPGPRQNQFFLAWKPETSDPGYQYAHPGRPGRFTGSSSSPLTIDYYTDENLLMALLAMGSPVAAHRVGREVWDAILRVREQGANFIKTYPGSLFTYQFASAWLDTRTLGPDNHPTEPVDFYDNTRRAIQTTRHYAMVNATNRATWTAGAGATRWGLSAAAGPVEYANGGLNYFADAARTAALTVNQNNPLEVGTVTVYAVGSSIVHEPQVTLASLWHTARHEDLNQDGKPDLLHPRFGFVDAFNLNIANAAARGAFATGSVIRPPTASPAGPWWNLTGYAIDHGPMLILIDNHLSGQFVPGLFMSHPTIRVALNALFPNLPPAVIAADFGFETTPHRVNIRFSENVQSSLTADDLVLTNLTTGTTIDPNLISLVYDSATLTASFRASGLGNGTLPDGNYRAVLPAGAVSDPQGNALADAFSFDFFFLNGDANRDGRVNLVDFNVLAANFGQSGRTFSQGDFNYDGIVNLSDFNILASRFGSVAGPWPAARAIPPTASPLGTSRLGTSEGDGEDELLAG